MTMNPDRAREVPQPVHLTDLIAAVTRYPGRAANGPEWFEWVLVQPDDLVAASFSSFTAARKELDHRIDQDPALAVALRLILIHAGVREGLATQLLWPAESTAFERAAEAAARLSFARAALRDWDEYLGLLFLRGESAELRCGDRVEQLVELWWPDSQSKRETVGYLRREEDGAWTLIHAHGAARPDPGIAEGRIADAVNEALGSEVVNRLYIRVHRQGIDQGYHLDLANALTLLAVDVAERLGVLDSAGEEVT
jgi:hypothetical protein